MIRFATQPLVPVLKDIWHTCFQDSEHYVAFLFDKLIQPRNVLVYQDDSGAVRGMLCMRPGGLAAPRGLSCRAAYIYGVATMPDARGRGVSTALLDAAHRFLGTRGVGASVLVPAGGELFDFYQKRGYENAFPLCKVQLSGAEMPRYTQPCVLASSRLEKLEDLRDQSFGASRMYFRWGRQELRVFDAECRFSGGEVLRFTTGGKNGYAVCHRFGGLVRVTELAAEGDLEPVLAAIHRRFGAEEYLLYLRGDKGGNFSSPVLPFAMIRWYDIEMKSAFLAVSGAPAYFAYALD